MSKFYGQTGDRWARTTNATRCGHQSIFASAQSHDGSLITELSYGDHGELRVTLEHSDHSASGGWVIFSGTMDDLLEVIRLGKEVLYERPSHQDED